MKPAWSCLLVILLCAGCVSQSSARRDQHQAFEAGKSANQFHGVTVLGPVQNPNVPWVAGLTLAQAIATANYLDSRDPKTIIITREGESATLDPAILFNGTVVPLEPGDVIEIR